MDKLVLCKKDEEQIKAKGITHAALRSQLSVFKKESFYENLVRPCTAGDGIIIFNNNEIKRLSGFYNHIAPKRNLIKFIPASGAATRMFCFLHTIYNRFKKTDPQHIQDYTRENLPEFMDFTKFITNINRFAFYEELKTLMLKKGFDIKKNIAQKQFQSVIEHVLSPEGLNYDSYPKGLIPFHRYADHIRTPFEEHLAEASAYVTDKNGNCHVHFTISPEHHTLISNHINTCKTRYEKPGITFNISLSFQHPSTDTIAVDQDNKPFRDDNNRLVFRPGGHGALLENLNNLKGDIVFLENIDNVSFDHMKQETVLYKTAIGGFLMELQDEIFRYLNELTCRDPNTQYISKMLEFAKSRLSIPLPEGIQNTSKKKQVAFLISKLNRPLRVCGMVGNTAKPGGGPFWVKGRDGYISLQIVENAQINPASKDQQTIFASSTHFNPVNIVCGMKDFKGRPFDLKRYVDHEAVFISLKSKDGTLLKALERPGLWNGSMADWNTVFVELPSITFNPVKNVLDLLAKAHQA